MKKGFTLAEVLITLAIIGVVAALTIPSVIINAREQGNITAFKKAVSVLNSAISLSVAVDSAGPSAAAKANDNGDATGDNLIEQLAGKMNTIASGIGTDKKCEATGATDNTEVTSGCYLTTADGMQFILMPESTTITYCPSNPGATTAATCTGGLVTTSAIGPCTDAAPCLVVVDVNGTAKPNKFTTWATTDSDIKGKVTDRFRVLITSEGARAAGDYEKAVIAK